MSTPSGKAGLLSTPARSKSRDEPSTMPTSKNSDEGFDPVKSLNQVVDTAWASSSGAILPDPFTAKSAMPIRTGFHLKAEAAPFEPNVNVKTPTGIASLNLGSLPDSANAIDSASAHRVSKAYKAQLSSPVEHPSDHDVLMMIGPAFTTDSDTAFDSSRYVAIHGLPGDWLESGFLENILDGNAIFRSLLSHKTLIGQDGSVALFCWFDDIREIATCVKMFNGIHPSCKAIPIASRAYFDQDNDNVSKNTVLTYDGQIEFIITFVGSSEHSLNACFEVAHQYSKAFGPVRSFAMHRTIGDFMASFRAEYYMLSTARGVLRRAGTEHQIAKDYTAVIHTFKPDGYLRYLPHAKTPIKLSQSDLAAQFGALQIADPSQPSRQMTPKRCISGRADFLAQSTRRLTYDSVPVTPSSTATSHLSRAAALNHLQSYSYHASGSPNPRFDRILSRTPSTPHSGLSRSPWSTASSNLSPLGRKHDILNQPQTVDVGKIESGLDVRTTLMIRNVPNRLNCEDFRDILDETSFGRYDFSYLRTDFGNNCNVGYAFVNFTRPEYILGFFTARVGMLWPRSNSDKVLEVSYATIQGQDCLIQKFRNSSVMQEYSGFRPKLWYTYDSLDIPPGKQVGQEQEFPKPDNLSKLSRSLDNAQAIGLYPPRGARANTRRRHGQYDRGTPHALIEETMHGASHPITDENTINGYASVRQQRMVPRFAGQNYNGSPLAPRSFNTAASHWS